MCTAINLTEKYHLFGRTLDLEYSYDEKAVITPRNLRLDMLCGKCFLSHLAIMGIACVREGIPLYYDAMNEAGLAVAALNFPDCAVYHRSKANKNNVASFELIPWVLCQCETVSAAVELLRKTNITPQSVAEDMPATSLHWIIGDKSRSVTVESVEGGLEIYENKVGVLTNAPYFQYHITRLSDHLQLVPYPPKNSLLPETELPLYSRGLGAVGLPGDHSSSSRFIRAVFVKEHTERSDFEIEEVSRFFHLMDTVAVPNGAIRTNEGKSVRTVYTSCACGNSLSYYFTTYNDRRIRCLRLLDKDLDSDGLLVFELDGKEEIREI